MKKNVIRVFSLILAFTMIFTLSLAAFAAEGQAGTVYGTTWSPQENKPRVQNNPPPYIKEIEVTFNGGDQYEGKLDIPEEDLNEQGEYELKLEEEMVIPEELIPGVTPEDRYYSLMGWVLEEDYELGNRSDFVDFETYIPNDDDTFVAVYLDSWIPYRDMKQDRSDWYYKFVRDLSISGVVNGTPDGDFLPAKALTYGEALKLVMLATGYDVQQPTAEHWASGYYTKALEDELIFDETIDLNSPITRREIAEIVVRALDLPVPEIESPFYDTDLPDAIAMYAAGLMIGTEDENGNTVFLPESDITRMEISTVVWRIYHYYEDKAI